VSNTEPIVMRIIAEDETGPAFDSASRTQRRNEQQVKRLVAKYKELEATVDMNADEIELYRAKLAGASDEQLRYISKTQEFIRAEQNKKTALEQANGGLRLMRGGLGQVGHQLQDIVVQAQMGTNGFLILGQQGSQIASLFGTKGALYGAVLALGAAFATFIQASSKGADSLKDLQNSADTVASLFKGPLLEGLQDVNQELVTLAQASEGMARLKIALDMADATQNLADAQRMLGETLQINKAVFISTGEGAQSYVNDMAQLGKEFGISKLNAVKLANAVDDLARGVDGSRNTFGRLAEEIVNAGEGNEKFLDMAREVSTYTAIIVESENAIKSFANAQELLDQGSLGTQLTPEFKKAADVVEKAYFNQLGQLDQIRAKHKANQKVVLDAMAKMGASQEEQVSMGIMLQQQYAAEVRKVHDQRLAQFEALDDARQKEADKAQKQAAAEQEAINRRGQSIEKVVLGEVQGIARINALYDQKLQQVENLYAKTPELAQIAANEVLEIEAERAFKISEFKAKEVEEERKAREAISNMMDDGTNKFMNDLAKRQAALEQARAANIINETEFNNYQKQLQTEYANHVLNEQLRIVGGLKNVEDSFVNASHAFITGAENGTEAIRQFGRAIVDELIKSLIQMGIEQVKQMIIKKKVEATALTQSVAANATAMTAIAAQAAPAAAAVSLATSGGNSVGAINGLIATHGVSRALSANSFEGGGFTGFGSRSGGIDGRGGFLATLHPNETVVDHSRGGGAGVTIINNIDASGSGDVDQRIAAAVTQASQQTVEQVHNMMRRGRM